MRPFSVIVTMIACSFGTSIVIIPAVAEERDASRTKAITSLIEQLDNRSFSVRRQAHQQLIAIGEPALELLRAAKSHRSAEVRYRVRALIEEIHRETLYTVTRDGRLIRLKVGKRIVEQEFVAKVGKPLDQPRYDVKALAMSPAGMLYATAGWPRCLYRINPKDGATKQIGIIAAAKINGLAFGPNGQLYGENWSCVHSQTTPLKQIVVIDTQTAKAISANVNVCTPRVDALAIDPSGLAIFQDEYQWLCRLDLREKMASESLIENANVGFELSDHDKIQGMCYAADGTLFSVCNKQNGFFVRIDPTTGSITCYRKLGFKTQNLAAELMAD